MRTNMKQHSVEDEQVFLGFVLLGPDAAVDQALDHVATLLDQFVCEEHRKILRAMIEVRRRGESVDIVTVADALKERGELGDVGGATYLAELGDMVPAGAWAV